ncbi:hypothetical protein D3C75_954570 [compost metagenome]
MTPGGDIHRAAKRAGSIQRRVHFHDHPVGDNALGDQLLCFLGSHLRDALAFAVQDTTHIREQDQVRAQRRRQSRCRLVSVDVHQQPFFGDADRAHNRQETTCQQGVNQRRRTRLRQANVAKLFVKLGHLDAVAVTQIKSHGGDVMFLRPCQQGFVGRSRQRTGDDVDLICRRDAQAIFLFHRQVQAFH